MKGLDAALEVLAHARRPSPYRLDHRPLVAGEVGPAWAIDGSSAVLADTGSIWVVAYRAAAVHWPGPWPARPDMEVVACLPADAQSLVEGRYAQHGLEGPRVRSAENLAEALRDLAEHACAVQAMQEAGALVYLDGGLHGLVPHAQAMADRLAEQARAQEIDLVAVVKRTRLTVGGVPALEAACAAAPQGAWSAALPGLDDVHVARLHAQAGHVFRIDGPEHVLPRVAAHARDAVYLGYPYPLALAHNVVAITRDEAVEARAALRHALGAREGAAAMTLLDDFHEVLDRNVA